MAYKEQNDGFPDYPDEDSGGSVFIFDPPPMGEVPTERGWGIYNFLSSLARTCPLTKMRGSSKRTSKQIGASSPKQARPDELNQAQTRRSARRSAGEVGVGTDHLHATVPRWCMLASADRVPSNAILLSARWTLAPNLTFRSCLEVVCDHGVQMSAYFFCVPSRVPLFWKGL